MAALIEAVRVADMRVNYNMTGCTVSEKAAAAGF
jgi:hypothetical protein